MSMLDTVGGLSGGLGGSGGVGGSIPSNSSAASASASVAVNPNTSVSGAIGGGGNTFGPFAVYFPGAESGSASDINSPPLTSAIFPKNMLLIVGGVVLLAIMFIFFKR